MLMVLSLLEIKSFKLLLISSILFVLSKKLLLFKWTVPEPLSGLVMTISFFHNQLITQKHFLCIVKSQEFIMLSQCKCARLASWDFIAVHCLTEVALWS